MNCSILIFTINIFFLLTRKEGIYFFAIKLKENIVFNYKQKENIFAMEKERKFFLQ